jgi:mono/diheme cytochrome c family protein
VLHPSQFLRLSDADEKDETIFEADGMSRIKGQQMRSFRCLLAVWLVALGAPAVAQPGWADPKKGRELAESLCSICHSVGPEVGAPVAADVPSFRSVANRADQSADRLAVAIIIPHPAMPTISFSNQELRDVISYILSLKTEKPASK